MRTSLFGRFLALSLCGALAACAGQGAVPARSTAAAAGPTPVRAPLADGSRYNARYVFVANFTGNTVTKYAIGASGDAAPLATYATAKFPNGLAVAPDDVVYVADSGANEIQVFDGKQDGFVAAPERTIAGPDTGLNQPAGMAVDSHNDLYVLNVGGSVTEYAPGANGDAAPMAAIAGPDTGLVSPVVGGVALAPNGTLYVLNNTVGATPDAILEFAAHSTGDVAPIASIGGPDTELSNFISDMIVAPDGTLYVSSPENNDVFAFAPGATGDAVPSTVLAGDQTQLNGVDGISFTPNGELYASNSSGTVVFFAKDAAGNVAPAGVLAGADTGLNVPSELRL